MFAERQMETDVDVSTSGVRLSGTDGLVRVVQQGDARPEGDQPPVQRRNHRCEATRLPDGNMAPSQRRRGLSERFTSTDRRHQFGLAMARLYPQELNEGDWTHDPIGVDSGVLLKLGDRLGCLGPKDPIDTTSVEPQRTEPLLELGDVVSPQHREPAVDGPITEPKPGFNQRVPALRPAHAVDTKAAVVLKSFNRHPRRRPEHPSGIFRGAETEACEPKTQIDNGFAGRPLAKG